MNKLKNLFKLFISCHLMLLLEALPETKTRVVGGVPTTIEKAKFLVQILSDGSILCGGTLVSERFVVTAAHCFDQKPKRLSVKGGASKLTEIGVRAKINKLMIPTAYNNRTHDMDVAVIKLRTPLKGELVEPTGLCESDWKPNDKVQIYGWGKRSEAVDNIPIQLHTAEVNVVDQKWCTIFYRQVQPLTDNMFCAAAHGKDACFGDSGGPAIINRQFCGIVSWGKGCGHSYYPGVYTNVNNIRQFIAHAMEQ